jgi:hypothetical protein
MKSKKALFEFFKTKYGKDLNLNSAGVKDETYGKKSFVYVWPIAKTLGIDRKTLVNDLIEAGFPRPGQWGNNQYQQDGVEIRVSYFKGWHWDV